MLELKVEFHGLREIDELLKQLPKQVAGRVLTAGLRAGGNVIRAEAKRTAPRRADPGAKPISSSSKKGRLPGYLRASIIVRAIREAGTSAKVIVGPSRRAFYGRFSEFGTSRQPARPWLRPAFDRTREAALKAIKESLGRNVALAAERWIKGAAKPGRRGGRR